MKRKGLMIVTLLMILDLSMLLVKHSQTSHALVVENSENKIINQKDSEIKTAEESSKNNNDIDLISLNFQSNKIDLKNTDFKISENLINDLNNTINNYSFGSSFIVVSLNDAMSFGYNIDDAYASGSTIKASYALYIYKLVAAGKASLDDTIAYEAKFYNKGTGLIKNSSYGTIYKVRDLIYNMIHESDNVAYLMLLDKYKWDGFNDMLDNLGAVESHLSNISRWGKLSCRTSAIIWQEIYRFSQTTKEGAELYDLFLNANYNYFKEILPDTPSASKTGFTESVVHATGIVMIENNPYIVIILSNTGGNMGNAYNHVKNMFSKIAPILQEYNNMNK